MRIAFQACREASRKRRLACAYLCLKGESGGIYHKRSLRFDNAAASNLVHGSFIRGMAGKGFALCTACLYGCVCVFKKKNLQRVNTVYCAGCKMSNCSGKKYGIAVVVR